MATLREIKKRVKSVNNISKITSAMQMVAASKMKRAQDKTEQFKHYAEKIKEATKDLSEGIDREEYKLLSKGNPAGKKLIVVISTNKGLCGGLNSNMFRQIKKWYPSLTEFVFITLGKKAQSFIRKNGAILEADFSEENYEKSLPALNAYIISGFLSGKYSQVEIIFNKFINSFTHIPTKVTILPIQIQIDDTGQEKALDKNGYGEFLIEPDRDKVLEALLPEYIENTIRDAAYSSEASEFSARMIAMKNATENAESLSDSLTLEYNKLRQKDITMSIADMVTARLAVE